MSWFRKLLPPKIKREATQEKKTVPEGLWSKCASCEAVLYFTDLENNLHVCPKCAFHNRLGARQRLDLFLDPEGRAELASEVVPMDPLKFKRRRSGADRGGNPPLHQSAGWLRGDGFRDAAEHRLSGGRERLAGWRALCRGG